MQKETQEKLVSPSQFMRQLRPELYSDSASRDMHQLKAEVLSHHLDTITERNETHDFELFCRKLCERAICPNLRPATGPEGGGDSKADTETNPVSDELSKLYVGMANSGRERWAFAFSAKRTWADKARSDVAGIIGTERGYTKIFFVTSRAARSKDRARVERELSDKYGVDVIIHDRIWIIDEVIEKNRRDLAYNYLDIGDKASSTALGPTDYSRQQQLADIEKELTDPTAFAGMEMQRATEALVAAKLARALELPRTVVDGYFVRAVRLADDGGTKRQQLSARYETLWTAFWWFDDIKAIVDGYDGFEALVLDDDHVKNLEMLCDLAQLLFNIVITGHLTQEAAGLRRRIDRLTPRLSVLAGDNSRPNNALEALTALLTVQVNEAVLAEKPARLSPIWAQFREVLVKAEGLGEFDANRLTRLIQAFGQVAGKDPGYRSLVDEMAEFVRKRTGEAQGALILLNRADQLDLDENMEMIRVLGKAARMLTKKEHAGDLVHAQAMLSIAYRSAGLLWAARASCMAAVTTLFIEADEDGETSPTVFPMLMNAAWQAVELKYFPEVLEIIRLARGCLKSLGYDDQSQKRAADQLHDFDGVLACQLANLSHGEVVYLEEMPDVLRGLGLELSRFTLLYMLGHESFLREEGLIPQSEPTEAVAGFFENLASQPAGEATWRPAIFNGALEQVFVTTVMGIQVHVTHQPTDTAITISEAVGATVEAFFATAFEVDAFAHAERFDIHVIEADVTRYEVDMQLDQMRVNVRWPTGIFPGSPAVYGDYRQMLLEVAGIAFGATCHAKDFEGAGSRLLKNDAAIDRVAMIASLCFSRQRTFDGVARLGGWRKLGAKSYNALPDRPHIQRKAPSPSRKRPGDDVREASEFPKMTDHRDVRVRSVIDVHLWNSANWTGAGYGVLDPSLPPFMALMFKDGVAAAKIFERWKERFGEEDKDEEIHIGIVRHFSSEHPTHYGMVITSKYSDTPDDARIAMMASRSLTMEPDDDVNLSGFLEMYRKVGTYLLIPLVLVPGEPPKLIRGLGLKKRALTVKMAADVGPGDQEAMFLEPRGHSAGKR
jgi:hypothetical protein